MQARTRFPAGPSGRQPGRHVLEGKLTRETYLVLTTRLVLSFTRHLLTGDLLGTRPFSCWGHSSGQDKPELLCVWGEGGGAENKGAHRQDHSGDH